MPPLQRPQKIGRAPQHFRTETLARLGHQGCKIRHWILPLKSYLSPWIWLWTRNFSYFGSLLDFDAMWIYRSAHLYWSSTAQRCRWSGRRTVLYAEKSNHYFRPNQGLKTKRHYGSLRAITEALLTNHPSAKVLARVASPGPIYFATFRRSE